MSEFIDIFKQLSPLDAVGDNNKKTLAGRTISSTHYWHFCINTDNQPVFIVELDTNAGEGVNERRLPNFEVMKWQGTVKEDALETEIEGAAIICYSNKDEVKLRFIKTIQALIDDMDNQINVQKLNNAIQQLIELFHQSANKEAKKSALGLWGELFLIKQSNDVDEVIRYWHEKPKEPFDFSSESAKIEVKSTTLDDPIHYFSFSQLNPSSGISVLIASIRTKQETDALSLEALWNQVLNLCRDNESKIKVNKVCSETLGKTIDDAIKKSYCPHRAEDSLKFYSTNNIAKITPPIPEGVTEVRFKSNLLLANSIDRIELLKSNKLHECYA